MLKSYDKSVLIRVFSLSTSSFAEIVIFFLKYFLNSSKSSFLGMNSLFTTWCNPVKLFSIAFWIAFASSMVVTPVQITFVYPPTSPSWVINHLNSPIEFLLLSGPTIDVLSVTLLVSLTSPNALLLP